MRRSWRRGGAQRRRWRSGGVQWRPPGAAKTRARTEWRPRRQRRGGTGEGWRRTGERPGGVVVQGGRCVDASELGRRSGTAAEQIKNCAQVLEEGGGRRDIYRGPPFCPGWSHDPGQKVFSGGPGKFPARGPPLVPGGSTTRDKMGPFPSFPPNLIFVFISFYFSFKIGFHLLIQLKKL